MPNRNLVKPVVANCWRCADPVIFVHLDEFCLTHQMGTLYLYFYTDTLEAISKMYLASDGTVLTQYKVLTTNELKLKMI